MLGLVVAAVPLSAQQAVAARDTTHRYSIAADYTYTTLDDQVAGRDTWKFATASLGYRTGIGPVIARMNYAERFGLVGRQFEADAYPSVGEGKYLYLNLGWSNQDLFPQWRSGAEFYTNLPNAYEASIGYRQLRFDGAPVTLFTGTVGKYTGNYWLSLRPFVQWKRSGTSLSGSLTGRRYFETSEEYIGARIGAGSAPADQYTITELARTGSFSADVHGSTKLAQRVYGTWTIGWEREQLALDRDRTRWDLTGGLKVAF
jgi:YaiO family outer membrane protein